MITDINSEDRLVQRTFADHLRDTLDWKSVYAHNRETFGPTGVLQRGRPRAGYGDRVLDALSGMVQIWSVKAAALTFAEYRPRL